MAVDGHDMWRKVLTHLETTMSPANFNTWLRPTRVLREEDGSLVIGCANTYAKEWLEQRLLPTIRKAIHDLGYPEVKLHFRVFEESPQPTSGARRARRMPSTAIGFFTNDRFNQRYTFESFIVGNNNRFAHAAAEAVAERPGETYNPLFIYGGVGLGKTHLLHAIGHRVTSYFPDARVVYTTCERFMNEMIKAVREGTMEEFRDKYRPVDVLLVDDIQFISGKEATQEEFFHTFNAIHDSGKQIVISSDRPPKMIATLEERLRSRFEWGLIADIQPPDLETRIAILRYKAEQQHVPVPADVIHYIARRIPSNIRELEGSFNRVLAYASLNEKHLSVELAAAALDSMEGGKRTQLTPARIIETVAQYYRVPIADLIGKGRDKAIVVPRQVAMYLVREETNTSLEQIGELLGGRDHTTVMHGWERVSEALPEDHQLRNDVVAIRTLLYDSSAS
jgi:chromosomal replication initiator protein